MCQCVTTPIKTDKKETCIKGCQSHNDVFCSSGQGLALFKVERGNYLSRTCSVTNFRTHNFSADRH